MKLSKKLIVPAFTLLAGASLVGSISGTIAWYQYSTRANVAYIGSSAGTIGNLQVRINDGTDRDWGTQVSFNDVENYLSAASLARHVQPVTPGALEKNDSLKQGNWKELAAASVGDVAPDDGDGAEGDFYYDSVAGKLYQKGENAWAESSIDKAASAPNVDSASVGDKYFNSADNKIYEKELKLRDFYLNPSFGLDSYNKWTKASADEHFVRIPLQLRFIGEDENDLESQNIYLSKLLIQKDRNNGVHDDISDAIRVHFSVYADGDEDNANDFLVSKNGGTTLTHGRLKLGRGADFDMAFDEGDDWGLNGSELHYVEYGAGSQKSYIADDEETDGVYYEEEFSDTGWNQVALAADDGEPDAALGNEGDFYLDNQTSKLYRKGASAWEEFSDFVSGAEDPDLNTERNNKNYYFKTGENKLFLSGAHEEHIDPILVSEKSNNPVVLENTAGRELGNTNGSYLNVDVTIWVEGWQKFNVDGKLTSIWKKDLMGAMFDVGMQFAIQDKNA